MNATMPPRHFIQTNTIRMAVYEAGPLDSPYPPIVLCHGFPELAYSWRWQIQDLANAGFRVIAPDQRGYGDTDAPEAVAAYDLTELTADLTGLLDAKGIEKAVFCGHDWGGFVVWQMGVRHPGRTASVIGLNTPFTKRSKIDPIEVFRQRFGDDMYIVFFQQPDRAEEVFEADIDKTFRFFMRRSDVTPQSFEARPSSRRNLALQDALQHYDPATDKHQLLTDAERAVFVEAFAHSGFRGPVNWYRNFTRNWHQSAHLSDHVAAPSLMIMAENDVVLPPSAADGMEAYVPNLEKVLIKGSGHWTQQEKPAEVSAAIIAWMHKTFAPA
ncbi:MAG: alpha/beta fold hydrolase [Caulobacterales bacterium]|jgi:pimeloyl-ACP methyl ester carboxylesterase